MEKDKVEIYGNLFGTINLLSEDHLDVILNAMDRDHSIFYIVEAVKSAQKRGAFTLGESEILSKAIRVLSRNE